MALEITAARPDPALLDLPWQLPLEEWPEDQLAALPRGISRHLVRFVHLSGRVLAIKETKAELARREYDLLRSLNRLDMPVRRAVRRDQRPDRARRRAARRLPGHPAPAVLAALPRAVQPDPAPGHRRPAGRRARRAAGAPAPRRVLLGRRVAVEHPVPPRRRRVRRLPRRRRDRRAARAAHRRPARARPGDRPGQHRRRADGPRGRRAARGGPRPGRRQRRIVLRYRELWDALTGTESSTDTERWRVDDRIQRLNDLGFDVDELAITTDIDGTSVQIQPKVVDAGHHSRRLLRLTGLDVARTRPAGCSTTSTPTGARPGGRARTRRSSRTTG